MSDFKHQRGFTLLELLVTLAVFVIIVTVAVPSFRGLADSNRMTGLTNEIIAAAHYARSEAVRRGAEVSLCASADGWPGGWSVREGNACTGTELRVWDAINPGPVMATRPASLTRLTFGALGGRQNNLDCFLITEGSGANDRAVSIGRSGAISVSRRSECPNL